MARIPSLLADAPTGLCPGLCTSDATFSAPKAYTALQRRFNWSHRTGSEGTGAGSANRFAPPATTAPRAPADEPR